MRSGVHGYKLLCCCLRLSMHVQGYRFVWCCKLLSTHCWPPHYGAPAAQAQMQWISTTSRMSSAHYSWSLSSPTLAVSCKLLLKHWSGPRAGWYALGLHTYHHGGHRFFTHCLDPVQGDQISALKSIKLSPLPRYRIYVSSACEFEGFSASSHDCEVHACFSRAVMWKQSRTMPHTLVLALAYLSSFGQTDSALPTL